MECLLRTGRHCRQTADFLRFMVFPFVRHLKHCFSFSGDFFLFAAVGLVETWKNGVLN